MQYFSRSERHSLQALRAADTVLARLRDFPVAEWRTMELAHVAWAVAQLRLDARVAPKDTNE